MRAFDGLRNQPQHGRIQPIDFRREFRMSAIHRQSVLREVVGADGKEVRFGAKLAITSRRLGTSTMMPQ